MGAILGTPTNGRYPTLAEALATYGKIRVALMHADQKARAADRNGVPNLLSTGQVYDYHVKVFAGFGLSSTALADRRYLGHAPKLTNELCVSLVQGM